MDGWRSCSHRDWNECENESNTCGNDREWIVFCYCCLRWLLNEFSWGGLDHPRGRRRGFENPWELTQKFYRCTILPAAELKAGLLLLYVNTCGQSQMSLPWQHTDTAALKLLLPPTAPLSLLASVYPENGFTPSSSSLSLPRSILLLRITKHWSIPPSSCNRGRSSRLAVEWQLLFYFAQTTREGRRSSSWSVR